MIVSENKLKRVVAESVRRTLDEVLLREEIKKMVRENFDSMDFMQANPMEKKKDGEKKRKKTSSKGGRHHERHSDQTEHRRQIVIDALNPEKKGKNDIKLDVAPYAYALWPDKDEDSARSYFYKCLKGETNDSGIPYEFDDGEINKLYSMLSNNSI